MGVAKHKVNMDFFEKDSEALWYFLGLLASDGYIADRIELTLNNKDRYILEKLNDLIQPTKKVYHKKAVNASTLQIDNRIIAGKVKKIFSMETNKKHEELRFPDVPSLYIKDFIRGYIDGDGCIDRTKGYRADKVYIGPRLRILGNEWFLGDMLNHIRNFVPNKTYSMTKKGKENVFYVTYNFRIATAILKWVYDDNTICLKRKYEKYLEVTCNS